MRKIEITSVIAGVGALLLAGCGGGLDDRSRSIARCERTAAQGVDSSEQAAQLCGCIVDDLAAEGLTITDMIGGDSERVQEVTRQCGAKSGINLPG